MLSAITLKVFDVDNRLVHMIVLLVPTVLAYIAPILIDILSKTTLLALTYTVPFPLIVSRPVVLEPGEYILNTLLPPTFKVLIVKALL